MEKEDPTATSSPLSSCRTFAVGLVQSLAQYLQSSAQLDVDDLRREFGSLIAGRLSSAPNPVAGATWQVAFDIDTLLNREPGAAIAVGLVADHSALVSVVLAPSDPDSQGDLISWVEGGPLLRNGLEIQRNELPRTLSSLDIVAIDRCATNDLHHSVMRHQPARVLPRASPIYGCALVAVGDVDAVQFGPSSGLIPLGGPFLRAVGGIVTEQPRTQDILGGHPAAIAQLASRLAHPSQITALAPTPYPHVLHRIPLRDPRIVALPVETLRRAQGAMLGQFTGDALGQLVEFRTRSDIAAQYPDGVRQLVDGGTWSTLAGQPTDDSEMALMLARSIVAHGRFTPEKAREAYLYWLGSPPFDIGGTTRSGLSGHLNHSSEANGSLMRVSPLAVHLWRTPPDLVAEIVAQDSALTHPNKACLDSVTVFSIAIGFALREHLEPRPLYDRTRAWVRHQSELHPGVAAIFENRDVAPVTDFSSKMGWVLIALRNAFHQLVHAPTLEEGVVATASAGGDTDTNAAIAGALLGAAHGRRGIPQHWQRLVLTCRSASGRRVRPMPLWADDLLEVTERLVL